MSLKVLPKLMVLISLALIVATGVQIVQCARCITIPRWLGRAWRSRAAQSLPCFSPPCPSPDSADRETLKMEQLEFTGLPAGLVGKLAIAAVVGLFGGIQFWGRFVPIRVADNPRYAGAQGLDGWCGGGSEGLSEGPCMAVACLCTPLCVHNPRCSRGPACRSTVIRPSRPDFVAFNTRAKLFSSLPHARAAAPVPIIR